MLRLLALVLTGALATSAAAQPAGRLSGRVTDAAGGALPGATVTAWGPVKRVAYSSAQGYAIDGLRAGTYRVTASLSGFRTAERTVEVKEGEHAQATLVLSIAIGEEVVVSASRTETSLSDAPATMSVVDAETIAASPAQNIPEMLRSVPGLNVVQTSARDLNLTARQSSAFLTPSQLTLVDGRPLYFDFFNVVFWDLLSVSTPDIDKIEVVRGPAATMWGANAVTGVVNVLTKAPRESRGLSATIAGGLFGRGGDESTGGTFGASARYAGVLSDSLSYRLSLGYSRSDAFERPSGTIPVTTSPIDDTVRVGGGSFDAVAYRNRGTGQPHADARVDQEIGETGRVSYTAGLAGTSGIIHTPIGPFDIGSGSRLGYGRASYTNGGFRASVFANVLSGDALSLVTRDATGTPVVIDFKNNSYDLDVGYTRPLGDANLVSAGGNYRYNTFDLSIAPDAKDRGQFGFWLQDELNLGRFHAAVGARVDKFENLDKANFSPRVYLAWAPADGHTFHASYNRAFRAPSALENALQLSVVGGTFPLGSIDPRLEGQQLPIVTTTVGNPDLKAETHDAYEVGYALSLGSTRFEVSAYLNEADDVISTTPGGAALLASGIEPFYTSQNPPPGWPFPPQLLDLLAAQGVYLPSYVKALNLGRVRNKGFEISATRQITPRTRAWLSYSYQANPTLPDDASDPFRPPADTISVPPLQRLGFGLFHSGDRWLGSLSMQYADKAFWTQVLSPQYYGYSREYLLVDASVGRRFVDGRVVATLKGTNLLGARVQQHVFGDILRRAVVAELQVHF